MFKFTKIYTRIVHTSGLLDLQIKETLFLKKAMTRAEKQKAALVFQRDASKQKRVCCWQLGNRIAVMISLQLRHFIKPLIIKEEN